jgi:hypothetical protein
MTARKPDPLYIFQYSLTHAMQDTHRTPIGSPGGRLISHVRGGIAGLEKEIAEEESNR